MKGPTSYLLCSLALWIYPDQKAAIGWIICSPEQKKNAYRISISGTNF